MIIFDAVMVIDENNDYAVGKDREQAWEAYCDDIGWDESSPVGVRWLELAVKAAAPAPVTLAGVAPDDGESTLTVS